MPTPESNVIDDDEFRTAVTGMLLLNGIPRDDDSARHLMATYVETDEFVIGPDARDMSAEARQAVAMAVCTHLGVLATVTIPTQATEGNQP